MTYRTLLCSYVGEILRDDLQRRYSIKEFIEWFNPQYIADPIIDIEAASLNYRDFATK